MKPPQGQGQERLFDPFKTAMMALLIVHVFAAPFRLLAYRLGSMGNRAVDGLTWIAAAFTLPLCLALGPPLNHVQARNAYRFWCLLLLLAVLHSALARLCRSPRHSRELGRPWIGKPEHGGLALAIPASFLAAASCGAHAGLFIALGWISNQIQLALIRARITRSAQIAVDQRLEASAYARALGEREA